MPNRKQKELMREQKRRKATDTKVWNELTVDQFETQRLMKLANEADQRGNALVFPKLPVKTRKRLKWKRGETTNHLTK